jgi:hypothetical protein
MLPRALLVWLGILALASLNGALRNLVMVPAWAAARVGVGGIASTDRQRGVA